MKLGIPFDGIVKERAQWDPVFRAMLLPDAIDLLISGEVQVGKIALRHAANSTIGFEKLASLTGKTPECLKRMLTTEGAPSADELFEIIEHIRKHEGVRLEVKAHSEETAVTQSA